MYWQKIDTMLKSSPSYDSQISASDVQVIATEIWGEEEEIKFFFLFLLSQNSEIFYILEFPYSPKTNSKNIFTLHISTKTF